MKLVWMPIDLACTLIAGGGAAHPHGEAGTSNYRIIILVKFTKEFDIIMGV